MNNGIWPILIPFIGAIILLAFPKKLYFQRTVALICSFLTLGVSIWLIQFVHMNGPQVTTFGDWPVPYGISFVSDSMSVWFVAASSLVTFFVIWYSFSTIGKEREVHFYYPGVLLLLVGVNGAFTTGDIFNLFVFFEVFLMASYLLSVLGGEKKQLRESIKYILVNVFASALFVIAVAMLYRVVGTLNMADISAKVSAIGDLGILTTISVLFLVVFGMKAAIFPFYYWLPSAYSAPPIPVLALFGALLTKVGVYSIMRLYTLLFAAQSDFISTLIIVIGLLTIVVGAIGAVRTFRAKDIMLFNILITVGVLLFAIGTFNSVSFLGFGYYVVHDMMIKAILFLFVGMMIAKTGVEDIRQMGGLIKDHPVFSWTFFIAALSLIGIPPFSGFLGKVLIVKGGFEEGFYAATIIVLLSSVIVLWSVIRIFVHAVWGEVGARTTASIRREMIPTILFLAITVAYGVFAELLVPYFADAQQALKDASIYIHAVLGGD